VVDVRCLKRSGHKSVSHTLPRRKHHRYDSNIEVLGLNLLISLVLSDNYEIRYSYE
jgi:hypothetical protein